MLLKTAKLITCDSSTILFLRHNPLNTYMYIRIKFKSCTYIATSYIISVTVYVILANSYSYVPTSLPDQNAT